MKKALSLVAALGLLAFVGCGGGDGEGVDITGTWHFNWSATEALFNLTQDSNNNISGLISWVVGNGQAPVITYGHMGGDTAELQLDMGNGVMTTITATINGTNATGIVSTKYPGEATPATFDLTGTKTSTPPTNDNGGGGGGGGGGSYSLYTGTQSMSVMCCLEGHCASSNPSTPLVLGVDSDGRLVGMPGLVQHGNSFSFGDANVSWEGTINGDSISGQIIMHTLPPGCTFTGGFTLTKSGQSSTVPTTLPTVPGGY